MTYCILFSFVTHEFLDESKDAVSLSSLAVCGIRFGTPLTIWYATCNLSQISSFRSLSYLLIIYHKQISLSRSLTYQFI